MKFTIEKFARKHDLYISEKSLLEFETIFKPLQLKRYDQFIKKGEIQTSFFILTKGIVRGFMTDSKSEKEYIKEIFMPVDVCGDLSALINNSKSEFSYCCLTNCTVLKGDFKDLLKLVNNNVELLKLYTKTIELLYTKAEERIYNLAVLNATERYLKLKEEIPNIDNLIQQYHIASYLNITPVQLSRIRKKIYSSPVVTY